MNQWQRDVRNFHYGMGQTVSHHPRLSSVKDKELRIRLITEEWEGPGELLDSLLEDDLTGIADGIADMVYVLLGTAVTYGIDMEPVWREVHATNMDKLRGPKREDGKQLKPADWVPPDIKGIIQDQIDEEVEKRFTRPINPDPVTGYANQLREKR